MTANERPKLGAILLAAGGSSRLGRPKQLLKFEGETLLRRAARFLADSEYFPIVVVLGAEADIMAAELEGQPVCIVVNHVWREGLSSSIRSGLQKLLEIEPELDGVLIGLCDQPGITTEMLNRFVAKFSENRARVIASAYDGVKGVPVLFSSELFEELIGLNGDRGARHLIRKQSDVLAIDLPEAGWDIDTPEEAARLEWTGN